MESTSRRTQHSTAKLVDVLHDARSETDPLVGATLIISIEALVAPLDAPDLLCFVVEVETHNHLSDDYVEAGAESTTSDDGRSDLFRVEEDVLSWSAFQELERVDDLLHA
jgi:hypothetical protein